VALSQKQAAAPGDGDGTEPSENLMDVSRQAYVKSCHLLQDRAAEARLFRLRRKGQA